MRCVVTGGCGFIGRAVTARLVEEGCTVTVLDRKGDRKGPDSGRGKVRYLIGDIGDRQALREAVAKGTDAVVHLAGVTSVLRSKENPQETFDTNVSATQLLLERSREVGVQSFVLASTNAVVGDVGDRTISESSALAPLTPYGATKAAAEMMLSCYDASYGIRGSAVRLTNVYGPGMGEKDSFVARLMRAARDGTKVVIYGDGKQRRDFVYLDDAVAGILLALRREVSGPLIVGSGLSVSVRELHRIACEATGVEISVDFGEAKAGEMPAVRVDISRASALGYQASVELAEGLRRTWEYFARDA
jgi:UDP-glucose 4-epimerase